MDELDLVTEHAYALTHGMFRGRLVLFHISEGDGCSVVGEVCGVAQPAWQNGQWDILEAQVSYKGSEQSIIIIDHSRGMIPNGDLAKLHPRSA